MAESRINPVSRVSGEEDVFKIGSAGPTRVPEDNPFEAVFSKAVDALEGVSQIEFRANDLISKYIEGKVDLSDVLIATSKMSISVQLAVTTITTAVSTFKEITQMQI